MLTSAQIKRADQILDAWPNYDSVALARMLGGRATVDQIDKIKMARARRNVA